MLQMEDCNGNISMVAKANNSIGTFICIPDELSLQGVQHFVHVLLIIFSFLNDVEYHCIHHSEC